MVFSGVKAILRRIWLVFMRFGDRRIRISKKLMVYKFEILMLFKYGSQSYTDTHKVIYSNLIVILF